MGINIDISDRIRYLREEILKIKQNEMSIKIGLKQGSLSDIERKKTKTVTDRVISDICREFSVNEEWLRTGKGTILKEEPETILDSIASKYNLDGFDVKILEQYIRLKPVQRKVIKEFLSSLGSNDEIAVAKVDYLYTQGSSFAAESVEEYAAGYSIEVIGRVAGGYPILAVEEHSRTIHSAVKADYALELVGDSMEPDYPNMSFLLIKRGSDIADGDVVVASILRSAEIAESTCKRFYHIDGKVELRPINPIYPVQQYKWDEIKIEGKVVGKVLKR